MHRSGTTFRILDRNRTIYRLPTQIGQCPDMCDPNHSGEFQRYVVPNARTTGVAPPFRRIFTRRRRCGIPAANADDQSVFAPEIQCAGNVENTVGIGRMTVFADLYAVEQHFCVVFGPQVQECPRPLLSLVQAEIIAVPYPLIAHIGAFPVGVKILAQSGNSLRNDAWNRDFRHEPFGASFSDRHLPATVQRKHPGRDLRLLPCGGRRCRRVPQKRQRQQQHKKDFDAGGSSNVSDHRKIRLDYIRCNLLPGPWPKDKGRACRHCRRNPYWPVCRRCPCHHRPDT